jgi:hypothetical protein
MAGPVWSAVRPGLVSSSGGFRWPLCSAAIAAFLASAPAWAQTAPDADRLDLVWRAPAECPDVGELRAVIEESADGDLIDARAAVHAERRADDTWVAQVRVAGEARELVGATCAEVTVAAGVVVGMALRRAPPRAATFRPAAQRRDERSPLELGASLRRAEAGVLALRAGVGADLGSLSGPATVARVGIGWARGGGAASLEGIHVAESGPIAMLGAPLSARTTLSALAARACTATALPRLWLCAGAEIGRMTTDVVSPVDRGDGSGLWLAASTGSAVAWPIYRPLELLVDAEMVVPLAYPRFTVNGDRAFGDRAPVAARAGLALRLRFP